MKNLRKILSLLTLIALLLSTFSIQATTTPDYYMEGATLRVNAKSGLKLREEPSLNSRVFTTMSWGDEVTVLNTLEFERSQTIELVEGNWVYVSFNGFKGFTFDGFLTDLPLAESNFDLFELIELSYDVVEQKDTILSNEGSEHRTRIYENGFELRNYFTEGGTFTELVLPNTRMSEAYMLCQNTLPVFKEFMKRIRVKRDEERHIVQYKGDDEFTEIIIREEGDGVVVSMYSGC
ncbi:MAG: SH3 domain-containing protein [Saprospiraceae bacterium]